MISHSSCTLRERADVMFPNDEMQVSSGVADALAAVPHPWALGTNQGQKHRAGSKGS